MPARDALARVVVVASTAAIAISGSPLAAHAANATPATPPNYQSQACPPGKTPTSKFTDISGNQYAGQINCISAYGITQGKTSTTYAPRDYVSRGQMAAYVYNFTGTTKKGKPSGSAPCGFTDISGQAPSTQNAICADKNAGIVNGKTSTTFDPNTAVRRDQMAAFIRRTLAYVGVTINPPAGKDYFDDDNGNTFQTDINALASVGLVQGTSAGHYSPGLFTRRDQMAVYLARALEYAIEKKAADSRFSGAGKTLTITPGTDQFKTLSGSLDYSIGGLTSGDAVTIQLFNCANVTKNDSGTTYKPSGAVADPGTVAHESISSIGGVATSGGTKQTVTASGSTLTFTVKNDGTADCADPVAYLDANNNGGLDVTSQGVAKESSAAGGKVRFISEADPGPIVPASGQNVSNPTDQTFDQGGKTYFYKGGDTYQLFDSASATCKSSSYAEFQARLSTGDQVTGTYAPTTGSTFCLRDTDPQPPASVTTSTNSFLGGVDVTFGDSPTPTVTTYNIYRATATPPGSNQNTTYQCPKYTSATGGTSPSPGQSPQTPPGDPYTVVGQVPDRNAGSYTFNDTQAKPAGANPLQPAQYCYVVSSIDKSGQTGTGREATSNVNGGIKAGSRSADSQPPETLELQEKTQDTFALVFSRKIDPTSCDLGDFLGSYTSPPQNSTTSLQIQVVNCDNNGTYQPDPLSDEQTDLGEAVITFTRAAPRGSTVRVTTQPGIDGDTVYGLNADGSRGAQASPYQSETTIVQPEPPMFTRSQFTAADTVRVFYDAWYSEGTVDTGDFRVTSGSNPNPATYAVSKATPVKDASGTVLAAFPRLDDSQQWVTDRAVDLTLATKPPANTDVTVTAQPGSDGNTVCTENPTSCQPASDDTTTKSTTADTTAPKFSSAAQEGSTNNFDLTYTEQIVCGTVDPDGSDYTASAGPTNQGPFTAGKVTAARCKGSSATDAVVVVTLEQVSNQSFYRFTSQNGLDKDTVTDQSGNPQPVGDQVTTDAAAQSTPTMVSASCPISSTRCDVLYDRDVTCPTDAGKQYKLLAKSTDTTALATGTACSAPDSQNQRLVRVTLDNPVPATAKVLHYTKPSPATPLNATYSGSQSSPTFADTQDLTLPTPPTMQSANCVRATVPTNVNCTITYDQAITCPSAAAPKYSLGGTAGNACTAGPSATQTVVTFSNPPSGTQSLSYNAPTSPTTSNSTYATGTNPPQFAPDQTLQGVNVPTAPAPTP